MDINSLSKTDMLRVHVKANARETGIIGYDNEKKAFIISVAAPADKDKANKELVRFLSKELKKKVRIKSGLKSREKVLFVE